MSNLDKPTVFVNEGQSDWGFGIVLEDKPDKVVFVFEKGGKRIFKKPLFKGLKPAELSAQDARELEARIHRRRPPQQQGAPKRSKPAKKPAPSPAQTYASFEEQLRWFEKEFVGGFEDEQFMAEERGRADRKGKNGYKAAAMALAREQLSPERFKTASPEDLFETAKRLIQFTNIVFPKEGAISFGSMRAEYRAPFATALGDLLHGAGEYGVRFERFVDAVRIPDTEGEEKKVTWPLATVIPAMYHPTEHICVKPTYFECQAPIVGLSADKSQPLNGQAYARFLAVGRATQERLLAAGHRPRDLMDVYSFIGCSQRAKRPVRGP